MGRPHSFSSRDERVSDRFIVWEGCSCSGGAEGYVQSDVVRFAETTLRVITQANAKRSGSRNGYSTPQSLVSSIPRDNGPRVRVCTNHLDAHMVVWTD